jgi:hypothetical protein
MLGQRSREITREQMCQRPDALDGIVLPERAGLFSEGECVLPSSPAKGVESCPEQLLALLLQRE